MSLYADSDRRCELIAHLRNRFLLSETNISDEDLLTLTEGTFIFAQIELKMSLSDLWKELKKRIKL